MPIKSLTMWGLIPWHGCIPSQPITFRWIPMRFGTHHKVVCGGRDWWLGGMGAANHTLRATHQTWPLPMGASLTGPHRPFQPFETYRGRLTRACWGTAALSLWVPTQLPHDPTHLASGTHPTVIGTLLCKLPMQQSWLLDH